MSSIDIEEQDGRGCRLSVQHGLARAGVENVEAEDLLGHQYLSGSPPVRLASVAWVKEMPEGNSYEIGGVFVDPTNEVRVALGKSVSEHGAGSRP